MSDLGIVVPFQSYDADVWSGRPIDFDAYRYAIKAFGLNKLRVINTSVLSLPGKETFDQGLDFGVYNTYAEFFSDNTAGPFTCFEMLGSIPAGQVGIPLHELRHQTTGWYVFGPTGGMRAGDVPDATWAYIPAAPNLSFHTTHAAAMVLWDWYRASLVV